MARVVSYDHHAAPYENTRRGNPPAHGPGQYVGKYDAPKTGTLVVARNNHLLTLTIGNKEYVLHSESESVLFTIDRDLTFEFVKEGTKVSKLVVREDAAIVEEAKTE